MNTHTLGQAALATYVLWGLYVLVMGLRRAQMAGTLSRPAFVLGLPLLVVGVLLDVAVNLVVCTVLLLELPRIERGLYWWRPEVEWTVTARLKRHKRRGGWRGPIAAWICTHLLDAFDPTGCHCD